DTGRLAGGITLDHAAIGLPVAREVTLDLAQRGAVRPAGMAIDARQPDRPIRKSRIQIGRAREILLRPVVLVPAVTDDPALARIALREFTQTHEHVVLAVGSGEIHAQ